MTTPRELAAEINSDEDGDEVAKVIRAQLEYVTELISTIDIVRARVAGPAVLKKHGTDAREYAELTKAHLRNMLRHVEEGTARFK